MLVVALPHYEFIRLSGADTWTFLQGQVSCDVSALTSSNSQSGALCNLKGRVIANFRLLRQGDDCLLQTQAGMARTVLDVLGKYAVFSKVDLQLEPKISAIGLLGSEAIDAVRKLLGDAPEQDGDQVQGMGLTAVALTGTEPRFEIWYQADSEAALLEELQGQPQGERLDWQRQDCRAGVVHVTPELSEQYTPQLLNYDISGVINFKKGCYTGQEVVARMFYRGKVKKRLYLFKSEKAIDSADPLLDKLTLVEQVAPCSHDPEGHLLLAIVDSEQADGELVTGHGDPLQKLNLPYSA